VVIFILGGLAQVADVMLNTMIPANASVVKIFTFIAVSFLFEVNVFVVSKLSFHYVVEGLGQK
jgi:hypothetical protein